MRTTLTSKKDISWTAVSSPTAEELAAFVREFAVLPIDAEFIAQEYRRPEITVRPQYILILTSVPVFNRQIRVTTGVPLYLLITEKGIATLHYEPIVVLEKLLQEFSTTTEVQEEYFGDGSVGLALYILNVLYGSAFNKLGRLSKHINIAEDAVFQGNERKMVYEISILVRDVMDFRKVVRPQLSLFAVPPSHALITEESNVPWQRLHGQINKLWDALESLAESARELGLVNSRLLQLKESELLQFLTYYSIFSIPALIILGPINPHGVDATLIDKTLFWGILTLLICGLIFIFVRFRGKRVLK